MRAAIATNPKIMPSKKPREDRHTPPHPLSITFMTACITKRFILRRYAIFLPLENVIMYQTVCRTLTHKTQRPRYPTYWIQ